MDDPSTFYTVIRSRRPFAAGAAGGGSTPAFRAKSVQGTAAGTSLTWTEPAGAAQDDVFVMFLWINEAAGALTGPTGWTQFYNSAGGTNFHRAVGYWIRRGASAPDLTMTWTNSNAADGVILAYSGCKTSGNPYDDLQTVAQGAANPANPDPPAVTTSGANRRVVALGISGEAFVTWTAPSGYADRESTGISPNFLQYILASDKEVASAGSENPAAWSGATANADVGAVTIALAP